jgi:hypothetical protein
MVAVEAALQARFGAHAGWAHTLLFISELASQRHRLPPHLQPGSRARAPLPTAAAAAAIAAEEALAEQAAADISAKPAAASAPASRRKRRAAKQLVSAEALWCEAEDAAGVGGLTARTLESTADTARASAVAVATNAPSCVVAVSSTQGLEGRAHSDEEQPAARGLSRQGLKAWRRRKAGAQAGLLPSPCSSAVVAPQKEITDGIIPAS